LIHQSWARSEAEIREKIYNWGHSNDFQKEEYLNFWNALNEKNFREARNFHWLKSETWPSLKMIQSGSIYDLLAGSQKIAFPSLSHLELYWKNSRFFSKLRKLGDIIASNSLKARV
jgi:hypothetical protein